MATLKSEDQEFGSSLTIEPGEKFTISAQGNTQADHPLETQTWQHVKLTLVNGPNSLVYQTQPGDEKVAELTLMQNALADIQTVAHAYLLCRHPQDEAHVLADRLQQLAAAQRSQVLFEPAEPSFELSVKSAGAGVKVEFFVDAGNVETGIYRWDALGIRFFTNNQLLTDFVAELKSEFAC